MLNLGYGINAINAHQITLVPSAAAVLKGPPHIFETHPQIEKVFFPSIGEKMPSNLLSLILHDFTAWFFGFSDLEGMFSIWPHTAITSFKQIEVVTKQPKEKTDKINYV